MYTCMNEIIDPQDKYNLVLKLCDFFKYDDLKKLFILNYEQSNKSIVKKCIVKKPQHVNNIIQSDIKPYIFDLEKDIVLYENNIISLKFVTVATMNISEADYPYKRTGGGDYYQMQPSYTNEPLYKYYEYDICTYQDMYRSFCTESIPKFKFSCNDLRGVCPYKLYYIHPVIREYPKFSTDDEINRIHIRRYQKTYNKYFYKIIRDIISFKTDDIICVCYEGNKYKLFSDTKEDEYENINYVIVDTKPIFNDKYFSNMKGNIYDIYEIVQ